MLRIALPTESTASKRGRSRAEAHRVYLVVLPAAQLPATHRVGAEQAEPLPVSLSRPDFRPDLWARPPGPFMDSAVTHTHSATEPKQLYRRN